MTSAKSDFEHDQLRARLPGRPLEQDQLTAFYRQKANECLRLAEATAGEARHQWLTLANGWTQLALHSER
jgi:hypothetical protein